MARLFVIALMFFMACPVLVQAQQDDEPLKLGAHSTNGKLNAAKLKQAIQKNKNFGKFHQMKPRRNSYAENINGFTSGKAKAPTSQMKTDFNLKMRKNRYGDVKIMPQPKKLKNIGCFGTADAGKC